MNDDIFISVDCETSGPYPGQHALLALGAAAVQHVNDEWIVGETYYNEWAPPHDAKEDPHATAVHSLDLSELRKRGSKPIAAAISFAAWVTAQGAARRIFVGCNAAFDWAFVLHAFGVAGVINPFHHAPLDIKSAIWGAHGGAWRRGSNAQALDRVMGRPLPKRDGLRPHHAQDDAVAQADLLVALLRRPALDRPPI